MSTAEAKTRSKAKLILILIFTKLLFWRTKLLQTNIVTVLILSPGDRSDRRHNAYGPLHRLGYTYKLTPTMSNRNAVHKIRDARFPTSLCYVRSRSMAPAVIGVLGSTSGRLAERSMPATDLHFP